MKLRLLAPAILLTVSTAAFASDSQFERTLNVSAQPDLYVSTGSGNITIHPGSDNQIHIVGHIHAGWSMTGGDQKPASSASSKTRPSPRTATPSASARPTITSSSTTSASTTTSPPRLRRAQPALAVPATSQSTTPDAISPPPAAPATSAPTASTAPRPQHRLRRHRTASHQAAGDIKAKTGSGAIQIQGLNGALTARTGSGDIEAKATSPAPPCSAPAPAASSLHLTPDAHFNLEASTGSGDIRVGFPNAPQQDDDSRHHLTGPVNGGGAPLEIRTGSGDVTIEHL